MHSYESYAIVGDFGGAGSKQRHKEEADVFGAPGDLYSPLSEQGLYVTVPTSGMWVIVAAWCLF
jgi:hypothetical protein